MAGSAVQGIDDGDVGVYLNGVIVEQGWGVAPLANRVEGRLVKNRITRDGLERLNGAVGGDDGLKFNTGFATELNSQCGVDWLYAV